jgi:exosome complex component RRP4
MRQYFQEGDLLVAEVQQIGSSDGAATLHTRSLKYGKLRNGVFLAVSGSSGAGVVRSRRQVWTVPSANGGGEVDIALGVNGYIWLSKHAEARDDGQTEGRKAGISISNLDEAVSNSIYSSQNDEIAMETRREIARLAGCIKILAQEGVKVDEETVTKAYDASLDADVEMMDDEDGGETLSADTILRKKIVAAVLH